MPPSSKFVADAFNAWLHALLEELPSTAPRSTPVAFRKGVFELRPKGEHRVLRGKASAPISLLTGLLLGADPPAAKLVYTQSTGAWNRVLTLLRDGDVQARYLDLVRALVDVGARDEARLAVLLSIDAHDRHERGHPLFAELFPALPAAARKPAVAGSEAAFLERRLREGAGRTAVDALLLALDINEHVTGAILDVAGQRSRLLKLLTAVDRMLPALASRAEIGTRDVVRLIRQQVGNALATRYEQA
ncbi:MAG: hypothetical protein KIS78_22865 [Labilithrix sp.]|nr:hypothetical protein [Labilithrix sp.]